VPKIELAIKDALPLSRDRDRRARRHRWLAVDRIVLGGDIPRTALANRNGRGQLIIDAFTPSLRTADGDSMQENTAINNGRLGAAEIEPPPHAQCVAQVGAQHATMWYAEGKLGGVGLIPGRPEPA